MTVIKKGHVRQFDAGTFPVNLTITATGENAPNAAGTVSVEVDGPGDPPAVDYDIVNAPIVVAINGSKCRVQNSTTSAIKVVASN